MPAPAPTNDGAGPRTDPDRQAPVTTDSPATAAAGAGAGPPESRTTADEDSPPGVASPATPAAPAPPLGAGAGPTTAPGDGSGGVATDGGGAGTAGTLEERPAPGAPVAGEAGDEQRPAGPAPEGTPAAAAPGTTAPATPEAAPAAPATPPAAPAAPAAPAGGGGGQEAGFGLGGAPADAGEQEWSGDDYGHGDGSWDGGGPETAAAGNGAGDRGAAVGRRRAAPGEPADDYRTAADLAAAAAAKTRKQVVLMSVLTAVVVVIGIVAFVISRDAADTGNQAGGPVGTTPTTIRTGPTIPEDQMQSVHDPLTGFTIKVPRSWQSFETPVADIRLVMAADENDGLSIRVIPIQTPATVDNIANFKAVTDTIVFGNERARLIQEQLVRLNGHLTYHYVYTFTDEGTGQEGVHAHYFVFEGNRMFSIVFQTIPSQDFPRWAAVFDQVAESFTVGTPTVTTTTPPTTVP
ncbi:MAG: hypothetical protein AB1673_03535 [Actinomycetota bacterium]